MRRFLPKLALFVILGVGALPVATPAKDAKARPLVIDEKAKDASSLSERGVLWQDPVDIESRDLFYGSGGREHAPSGVFTFLEEDLDGSNPKIEVRDQDGVKWKVKLVSEARPETAASRFVWAAGYFANEDYFVENLKVLGLPQHLKRGQNLVGPDGSLHNVRLKRHLKGEEKLGTWGWRQDPFTGTREFNGLRVLMALINNWDLKDQNNAIYKMDGSPEPIYMIGDLGASLGTNGYVLSHRRSRGNLTSYNRSQFIRHVSADYVDFQTPSRPTWLELSNPALFMRRVHFEWIGKRIPRADAAWMGRLLARLSSVQVRDAFRGAGYSPEDVEGFAAVVQGRIRELNSL